MPRRKTFAACLHCRAIKNIRSRGLCGVCFYDPAIRPHFEKTINPRCEDLTGRTYTRLRVEGHAGIDKNGHRLWRCRCECGNEITVTTGVLNSEINRSCGCLRKEMTAALNYKHGHNRSRRPSPEYRCWTGMVNRCTNPNGQDARHYFERGISLHQPWRESFAAFLADVGPMPAPRMTLDRIDNDKGYEPGNVRWATMKEQNRNKRSNRLITFNGETLALADWADRLGIPHRRLRQRLDRGMPLEKALSSENYGRNRGKTERSEEVRVYGVWSHMRTRCYNQNSGDYHNYGGRGIVVCDRWRESFQNFLADMGMRPSPKHSLERLDRNGPYSPENCKWATATEQARNTSRNRFIEFAGETLTLSEWSARTGLPQHVLGKRLKVGWTTEKALTEPIRGS